MRDRDNVREIREALVDVWSVIRQLGLDKGAKRQPRGGAIVCCPAHGDRTPSCSVTLGADRTIRAKCFSCDWSGDVLGLVAAARGLDVRSDFPAVLTEAADIAGIRLDDARRQEPRAPRAARPAPPPEARLGDDAFGAIAADIMAASPLAGDVADYLARRGLRRAGETFGLGALPLDQRRLLGELARDHGAAALVLSGLVRATDDGVARLDRFAWPSHRLVIPWFGPGETSPIASLQRRRLDGEEPRYVSPPGRRSPFPYGVERLLEATPRTVVVFVEGALDVLAATELYAADRLDRVALGIPGLANWRPEWAAYARGREALIAVDSDPAGERAVDGMLVDLIAAGARRIARSETVRGKDWAMAVEALR